MDVTFQPTRRLFSVAEYHRLGEAGVLTEDDRVELIEGEILAMTPIGSRHAACVDRLTALLVRAVSPGAIVRVQNPIRLGDRSEPEPDLCVLRPRDDYYAEAHPGPADVLLIVEVSDPSAGYDRATKLPLYAGAGVPESWIVDLLEERVEVHAAPSRGACTRVALHRRGDVIESSSVPGLSVDVEGFLGSPPRA